MDGCLSVQKRSVNASVHLCAYLRASVCTPVCICFSFSVLTVLEAVLQWHGELLFTVYKADIKSNYLLIEED